MQPFERLRYLARWSDGDGTELLSEAADCLADFDGDPAGLVVACRRLLAHHPTVAPLWWLCSRVLAAGDVSEVAYESWTLIRNDRTAARLAAALPFPHDDPIAVLGWPEVTADGLADRTDLDVLVVRTQGADHLSRRLRRSEHAVRVVGETELLALGPTHLLVEADAAGGQHALVPAGTSQLVRGVHEHGATVWLVAGMGRVLPERLFEALRRAAESDSVEVMPVASVDRVVGPSGLDSPTGLARRADCPTAPELLRLTG